MGYQWPWSSYPYGLFVRAFGDDSSVDLASKNPLYTNESRENAKRK